MDIRGYGTGPVTADAAFTSDFAIPDDIPVQNLVDMVETERRSMDLRPGMRHKYKELEFEPGVKFWDRPFFLGVDGHIWRVTGAHDFTPLATTHYASRFERCEGGRQGSGRCCLALGHRAGAHEPDPGHVAARVAAGWRCPVRLSGCPGPPVASGG